MTMDTIRRNVTNLRDFISSKQYPNGNDQGRVQPWLNRNSLKTSDVTIRGAAMATPYQVLQRPQTILILMGSNSTPF